MARAADDGSASLPDDEESPDRRGGNHAEPEARARSGWYARRPVLETIAVVVLSITTVLTAWSAFQSSKWGGAMSISFSQASSARIEAARLAGTANVRTSNQIGLWTEWVAAVGNQQAELADFLVDRFPEPLATAHEEWIADGGRTVSPPTSPFDSPSFVLPEQRAAAAADERADARFALALAYNQRSDNYTILTVLFAGVLFFSAMSGRVRALGAQQVLLGAAMVLGVVGVVLLSTLPKLV
jgi:hypothetical protein